MNTFGAVLIGLLLAESATAQGAPARLAAATESSGAVSSVGTSSAGGADGEAVFRRVCAACHLGLVQMGAAAGNPLGGAGLGAHAVPREMLSQYPPEAILNALTNGKMQAQGATLTPAERRAVAQFTSGREFTGGKPADPASEAGPGCAKQGASPSAHRGDWNGWGNGVTNARYQARGRGGLSAAQLPHLTLKWAFGFVNVGSVRSQPAVMNGRVYVGSENGQVHALDAVSGCTYWSFKAEAGVVTALTVGPYTGSDHRPHSAVYFGDRKANAYAVDAASGQLVWARKVDSHPAASITGSPTVYDGRVYVPVQGIGEEGRGGLGDYACCTFRGSVSALDASTGAVLWKTYTVAPSAPRAKSKSGVQLFGPAGGGIWSAPTVDAARRRLYVATGNGYAEPAQPTTDAVIALDLATGAIRWVRQLLPNDIWVMGCDSHANGNPACPGERGPDFDFSAPPILTRSGSRDFLVLPQKSGMAFALDPARDGALVWSYRIGQGSGLGGEWGGTVVGDRVFFGVADILTPTPGGVHAVQLGSGQRLWHQPPPQPLCGTRLGCSVAQGAALTAIPGAVLSGALDGGLRAYAVADGALLWTFDTAREFTTVNGVKAHGGGIDGAGPVVAGGMLYVNSGSGALLGHPGNVLLALGLD
jgi:polyvinyl alcohol dehydrogenase (cytochrome)